MSSQSAANYLVAALNSAGVRRFFIAPGSRSQALVIAAAKLEEAGLASCTVRLDERSLGFTALGSALATGEPAAVIVTSGTAVGNLMPAVLEAHHSRVPLILITADRPARLRGTGANQTLEMQSGIFGFAAEAIDLAVGSTEAELRDAAERATSTAGPIQLNLQLDLPLSSNEVALPEVSIETSTKAASKQAEVDVPIDNSMVVIAGAGGKAAVEFAEWAKLPLVAEPNSGARAGSSAVQFALDALEQNKSAIKRVAVFGRPTLSRAVQHLIATAEIWLDESALQAGFRPLANIAGQGKLIPVGSADLSWRNRFATARELSLREGFVSRVWDKSDRLVLGASDLIRDLDQVASPKEIEVYANRGLSGIDGTISTALGIALERGETNLLVGDLTLLHDSSGLNLTDLGLPPLRIVVGNDRGGHIFTRLEIANEIDARSLERFFVTPQQVDLAHLAAAYGWDYVCCTTLSELESALSQPGPVIIDYQL